MGLVSHPLVLCRAHDAWDGPMPRPSKTSRRAAARVAPRGEKMPPGRWAKSNVPLDGGGTHRAAPWPQIAQGQDWRWQSVPLTRLCSSEKRGEKAHSVAGAARGNACEGAFGCPLATGGPVAFHMSARRSSSSPPTAFLRSSDQEISCVRASPERAAIFRQVS